MATKIDPELTSIRDAQYGATVRTAIISALEKMCTESDAAVAANTEAQTTKNTAVSAKNDAVSAKTAAITAKDDAVSAKNDAVSAKTAAESAKSAAQNSATNAANSATTATTAKNDAVSAKNAAVSAKTAAESAKTAAQTSETNAATSENNAAASATAATNAKNDAVSAKNTAVSAKDDALSAKNAAQTSESNAATSETNAAASATTATNAKDAAVSAKNDAQTSASNAATSETNAAASATAASTSATNAATSATSAANSATTATIAKNDAVSAKTSAESAATSISSMVDAIEDYIEALYFSSRNHRNILRGKNLGTEITAAQWATIQSGEFTDMYIGDYWVLGDTKYYIADIDLMYNRRDTVAANLIDVHHLFIIPNKALPDKAKMYNSGDTINGYQASIVHQAVRDYARTTLKNVFGESHVLNVHRGFPTFTSGVPTGATASMTKAAVLTERQVFGSPVNSIMNAGQTNYHYKLEPYGQLAIFALDRLFLPSLFLSIGASATDFIWLQDTCSSTDFAAIQNSVPCHNYYTSNGLVLPTFFIGTAEEEST